MGQVIERPGCWERDGRTRLVIDANSTVSEVEGKQGANYGRARILGLARPWHLEPIPAKDFWSVVVYDLWTRSMLANGQALARHAADPPQGGADRPLPSLNSYSQNVLTHDHGGVDIYIGQQPPPGQEHNWIRTLPDTGWFPTLRI